MRLTSLFRSVIAVLFGSLIIGVPALAAQSVPAPPDGITVTGYGQASAPADSSTIQITIASEMYGPPMAPEPGATPGAAEMESAQPVVDALVEAGVPEADIEVVVPPFLGNAFGTPFGPATALITISATNLGAEEIRAIISAATIGAADAGVMVGGINTMHTLNDCSQLMQDARQSAYEDAERKAGIQADIIGVSLGDVVASRDNQFGPSLNADPLMGYATDGSCTYAGTWNMYGPYGPMPYDLAGEPEVVVYATLDVTFGMQPGAEATPAS
jgi:uncharacterized protein YggE